MGKRKQGRKKYGYEALRFVERLVWLKTRGRCLYCKKPVSYKFEEAYMIKDHFIPLNSNGHDDHSNLMPSCRPCDSHKGARLPPKTPHGLIQFSLSLKEKRAYVPKLPDDLPRGSLHQIERDVKTLKEMGRKLDLDIEKSVKRLILPATPLKRIRHPVVYKEMLPGCVGFMTTNGDCIHYGEHYRGLQNPTTGAG